MQTDRDKEEQTTDKFSHRVISSFLPIQRCARRAPPIAASSPARCSERRPQTSSRDDAHRPFGAGSRRREAAAIVNANVHSSREPVCGAEHRQGCDEFRDGGDSCATWRRQWHRLPESGRREISEYRSRDTSYCAHTCDEKHTTNRGNSEKMQHRMAPIGRIMKTHVDCHEKTSRLFWWYARLIRSV
jgi:hypothetical protein